MRFYIYNYGDETFTVNVYKKGDFFCYQRWDVSGHSTSYDYMNTDPDGLYYIRFDSPCYFNYSVKNANYK